MDNHYWQITLRDGQKIQVPPEAVEIVKRRWEANQPIKTSKQIIPIHQIVAFEKTSRTKAEVPLVEAAAQAFKEEMLNEDGSVICRWVKMQVTSKEWEKHYSPHHYKRLADEDGMVVVAWFQPAHLFNSERTSYCTDEEIKSLTT